MSLPTPRPRRAGSAPPQRAQAGAESRHEQPQQRQCDGRDAQPLGDRIEDRADCHAAAVRTGLAGQPCLRHQHQRHETDHRDRQTEPRAADRRQPVRRQPHRQDEGEERHGQRGPEGEIESLHAAPDAIGRFGVEHLDSQGLGIEIQIGRNVDVGRRHLGLNIVEQGRQIERHRLALSLRRLGDEETMSLAIGLLPGLAELFAGDHAPRHLAECLRDDARLQRFGRGGVVSGQRRLDAGRHRAGDAQLHLGIVGGGPHRLHIDVFGDDGEPCPPGDQCHRHRQAEEDQEDPAQDAPPDRRAPFTHVLIRPAPARRDRCSSLVAFTIASQRATHPCHMPRGKRISSGAVPGAAAMAALARASRPGLPRRYQE